MNAAIKANYRSSQQLGQLQLHCRVRTEGEEGTGMALSLLGSCKLSLQRIGVGAVRQHTRLLQTSLWNFGAFEDAKENIKLLKEDPGNQVKLQLYALFKQGSSGKVTGSRPGMMDFVGRAKWDAWNQLGDMSKENAQEKYIKVVDGLVKAQGVSPGSAVPSETSAESTQQSSAAEGLLVTRENKMTVIKLNRPTKKNAITTQMYGDISSALEEAGKDSSSLAVLTGAGDYYCSGNDLANFMGIDPSNMAEHSEEGGRILQRFVGSFIDFPKPLIAVVNGPAVGVSVTVLGLFDAVYATDRATFHTPFSHLGQLPEGCSSYTFPKIMGTAKAQEMLLFNRKLTAKEACERGLVSEVFPDSSFQETIWPRIKQLAQLPPQSLRIAKNLVRDNDRQLLHRVNEKECKLLADKWQSEECINAVMSFFSSKM